MAGYGNDSLTINVYLLPLPGTGADLRTLAYGVPKATNSLNGARYRPYLSATDAASDLAAGYISAQTASELTDVFSQTTARVEKVLVFNCDLAGAEHYADTSAATSAIDVAIAAGMTITSFFGVAIQSDTAGEQLKMSVWCESHANDYPHIFFLQSTSVDWYGATWPAAFSTIQTNKWSASFFHTTATQPYALCVATERLAYDPDAQSAGWRCEIVGVAAYTAALTSANKVNALANHVNLLGAGMGSNFWSDLGLNFEGRQIKHLVSAAWLRYRMTESIQFMVRSLAAQGLSIPVNTSGAKQVESIVAGVAQRGVSIGHFDAYTDSNGVKYPKTSSTYSRSTNTITVTLDLYFNNEVQTIVVNAYLNEAEA